MSDSTLIEIIAYGDKSFEFHCYSSIEQIETLLEGWRDLETRSQESYSFFQSSQWCFNWLKHFKSGATGQKQFTPRIYTLECAGSVHFLIPLMEEKSKVATTNLLALSDPLSQYSNLLVDCDKVDLTMGKKLIEKIVDHNSADTFCVTFSTSGSFLAAILEDQGNLEGSDHSSRYLDLSSFDNWESYHMGLRKSQRKERNRRRNKLEKIGELDYKVVRSNSTQFKPMVLKCLEMKDRWLKSVGKSNNALKLQSTKNFLSEYSNIFDEALPFECDAIVHSLTIDGIPIAMELGYIYKGDYYSFLGSIDIDWYDYSPGKIQIEAAQKWAKSEGLEKFDFLNDPSPYKASWTDEIEPLQNRFIPISTKGYVYCKIWKLGARPKLQSIYEKTGGTAKRVIKRVYGSI